MNMNTARPLVAAFVTGVMLFTAPDTNATPNTTNSEKAGGPANPIGAWTVGPVLGKGGAFAYCFAESRFDNGQSLIIARNIRDETNIGLGLPQARLTKGTAWKVKVVIEGSLALSRDRQAVAADPDMLAIANGADDKLFEALSHGTTLRVEGPSDTVAFQLNGSNKSLPELRSCVERARAGQPLKPLGRVGDGKPQLPPLLKKLLAEAGFTKIGLMSPSAAPPGYGTVDTLWKIGSVTSGLSETRTEGKQSLSTLADSYLSRLKGRCGSGFQVKDGETLTLTGGSLRSSDVTCRDGSSTMHIALLFNMGRNGLFKSFFHESPDATAVAKNRDAIAEVIKRVEDR
ncbi:MAG: hypothetical protein WCK65_01460 [Rhodospirillaceae bacterium]